MDRFTARYPRSSNDQERKLKPDNHWFDCLAGCAVAATLCGLRAAGEPAEPHKPRLKWSEFQRRKCEGRL